jgi:hypothetical protein
VEPIKFGVEAFHTFLIECVSSVELLDLELFGGVLERFEVTLTLH